MINTYPCLIETIKEFKNSKVKKKIPLTPNEQNRMFVQYFQRIEKLEGEKIENFLKITFEFLKKVNFGKLRYVSYQ
jgi:hypothetical protein